MVQFGPNAIDDHQGQNPTNRIGKSGCILSYPKYLHGQRLHPDEQWRLFPKWQVIDQGPQVIFGNQHFPADLRKIDFIPVKEVNAS